jgi:excisionase family DNA binding protein
MTTSAKPASSAEFTTLEVARLLGMSVRSVQLMVDRGHLQAWKTAGGHRRISRESVELWRRSRGVATLDDQPKLPSEAASAQTYGATKRDRVTAPSCVLLIEDSLHFQKLMSNLIRQRFPGVELHVADDGIAGLALHGRYQPRVMIVDILIPGIDGATLITSLRTHPQFGATQVVVVTSLNEQDRAIYSDALQGVPVIHKPRLVLELPPLLAQWLPEEAANASIASAVVSHIE